MRLSSLPDHGRPVSQRSGASCRRAAALKARRIASTIRSRAAARAPSPSLSARSPAPAKRCANRSRPRAGRVKGEFPALDAITADVSCADLKALAGFRETASVSDNAQVHGHQLDVDEPVSREPSSGAPASTTTTRRSAVDDGTRSAASSNTTNFIVTAHAPDGGAVGPAASVKSLCDARRARGFVVPREHRRRSASR